MFAEHTTRNNGNHLGFLICYHGNSDKLSDDCYYANLLLGHALIACQRACADSQPFQKSWKRGGGEGVHEPPSPLACILYVSRNIQFKDPLISQRLESQTTYIILDTTVCFLCTCFFRLRVSRSYNTMLWSKVTTARTPRRWHKVAWTTSLPSLLWSVPGDTVLLGNIDCK